jgi:hypothetical protein
MNFKIGKYLNEGLTYKNAMVHLANDFNKQNGGGLIDLVVFFENMGQVEKKGLTLFELLVQINEACIHADKLPVALKDELKKAYIHWRDNELPIALEEERQNGKEVFEPEM